MNMSTPDWMKDPQGLALLKAARQAPGEKAVRLVLSDWLEEQGEAEAAETLRASLQEVWQWEPFPPAVPKRWGVVNGFWERWPGRQVSEAEFAEFLELPPCAWLLHLGLSASGLNPESVVALTQSPHLANLASLCLWESNIGDEGAAVLAESRYLANLTTLDLCDNKIGDGAKRQLRERFAFVQFD